MVSLSAYRKKFSSVSRPIVKFSVRYPDLLQIIQFGVPTNVEIRVIKWWFCPQLTSLTAAVVVVVLALLATTTLRCGGGGRVRRNGARRLCISEPLLALDDRVARFLSLLLLSKAEPEPGPRFTKLRSLSKPHDGSSSRRICVQAPHSSELALVSVGPPMLLMAFLREEGGTRAKARIISPVFLLMREEVEQQEC